MKWTGVPTAAASARTPAPIASNKNEVMSADLVIIESPSGFGPG
jgi:hypothetical protein